MKACIVGAGAIGGHVAVKLARAGATVSVLARGATLEAIRANGLVLEQDGQQLHADVKAADDAQALGPQDLVLVTTKSTALGDIARQLPPLVGPHTSVAFLQNGVTWWYPLGLPAGKPRPPQLPMFALADAFLRYLRPEQVLGGIIYSANEVLRPGVVRNNSPRNAIELAAVDDSERPAVTAARALLEQAGIESPAVREIRANLWLKLVGNACASPLSVAMGNPSALVNDPALNAVYVRMLKECLAVAAAHGYDVADQFDLTRWTQHRARHKPSMLQDYEAGRAMEVGEMVLAPVAFARAAGVDAPTLEAVSAIVARLAIDKGLFTPA
ncbi:2-dehydropantoate 2-reductase [Ramlibacter sp. G-1-2-2]|uniref:2-dehydropantoate 2-reductase n=1 Tax=Ramlibacter agri TaxID=2728837 RepID=A0A848H5N7_9BURK|nr:2-dehydropantoate 2-reductase [Ramlibacter agri]